MFQDFQRAAIGMSILLGVSTALGATPTLVPSDGEIRKILTERIGENEKEAGIVVGVIEPQGRRINSCGHRSAGDARPLDGDTVFEIASVTKVFTALLLADMVGENEVALSDPAAKYLRSDLKIPERNGRSITLVDLATHTSGLPFMPADAPPFNDPAAAKYSTDDLKHYLVSHQLTRDIGSTWEYSNIGYWVLSEALANRAGEEIKNLVRTRVLAPLKMNNTDFALSPTMKFNLAPGHDSALQAAPAASTIPIYSIMPAIGLLYSTTNDLLTFLAVCIGYDRSPLAPAITTSVTTRRPVKPGEEQALGWTIFGTGDDQVIFRDGSSFGYASVMAYDPKKRVGVVVLTNQIGDAGDIARHLLRPEFPLAKPAHPKHTEIALDPKVLDSYAGRFEAKGEGIFTVARQNDFLTIESPADWGLPKLRILPESLLDFFAAELPLRVTFICSAARSEGGKIDNGAGGSRATSTGKPERVDEQGSESINNGRVTGILIYPPRGQKAVPATKLKADK
jgi:CubicO group peptidase (beta-lactamase class C family)